MYDIEDEDNPHKKYTQKEIEDMLAEPIAPYILNLNDEKRYSYKDYLGWMDDVRRELINGFIYLMSGPRRIHQEVAGKLYRELSDFVDKNQGRCEVFIAPFDVCFFDENKTGEDQIRNVVQPDVFVVCDPEKLTDKACYGPPDLIVEVLSASTRKKDMTLKFLLYEKYGVREYWVVDPQQSLIKVFLLAVDGKYADALIYKKTDQMTSAIFPDFSLDLTTVFPQ